MTRSPSSRSMATTELMMLDDDLLLRISRSPFSWQALGAVSSRLRSIMAARPPAPLLSFVGADGFGTPIDVDLHGGFMIEDSDAIVSVMNLNLRTLRRLAMNSCCIQMARADPMMFDVSCFGSCSMAYRVNEACDWRTISRGTVCLPVGGCVALLNDTVETTMFRVGRTQRLEASGSELELATDNLRIMHAFQCAVDDLKKRTSFGPWVADPNSAFKYVPTSFALAAHGNPGKVLENAVVERLLETVNEFDVSLCDPSLQGVWRGSANALNDFRFVGSRDDICRLLKHLLGDGHSPVKKFKRSNGEIVIHCEAKSSEMDKAGCLKFTRIKPANFALILLAAQFQSSIAIYTAVESDLKLVSNGEGRGGTLHLSNNTGHGTTFAVNGDHEKSARSEKILRTKLTGGKAVHLSDIRF